MRPTVKLTALLLTAAMLLGVVTYGPAPDVSAVTQAQLASRMPQ